MVLVTLNDNVSKSRGKFLFFTIIGFSSQEKMKIKGISSLKNNIIKASIEDLDNPDYDSISNIINENLLKKFK